jgi:hypothetical protein
MASRTSLAACTSHAVRAVGCTRCNASKLQQADTKCVAAGPLPAAQAKRMGEINVRLRSLLDKARADLGVAQRVGARNPSAIRTRARASARAPTPAAHGGCEPVRERPAGCWRVQASETAAVSDAQVRAGRPHRRA